ncbi:unnamed protein product [Sphenostylis stenocarpa]|uniref:SET domain-containing protein n=1 Tax=Sphenostylis stenocarpa TaxID=92480 RepID=A0AA86SFG1_9FABA|nr:unnamed protein product [Sphenostylis stenocarpa]
MFLITDNCLYPIQYGVLKEIEGISSETILLLWSMKEKYNSDSKFKIYFDTLPEKFNTGLSFSFEAITMLDGTLLLEEIMHARQHLHAQYDELFPALSSTFPDIFPPELYTWKKFLWACELWYSNSMKIMYSDGKLKTCLIPIAGFLNHSVYIDGTDVDSNDIPSSNWTSHMVRGTWLSKDHRIFYYGLPSPLLDHLRRSQSPMLRTKTFLQESLENELEVLENLKDIFDDMVENMGENDLDDRENCSQDEKLAMDFKNTQRRIACSVSTSCDVGMDMLKNELRKCMAEDILG